MTNSAWPLQLEASAAPKPVGTRRLQWIGLCAALILAAALGWAWTSGLSLLSLVPIRPNGPGPAAGVAPPRTEPAVTLDLRILVDQFGYLPDAPKVAVIRSPRQGFDADRSFTPGATYEVRRVVDGDRVLSGSLKAWNAGQVQGSSGDVGWWFDFSELTAPGRYYVHDPERKVRSATFSIGPAVYDDVLRSVMRTYYYQRSGMEKKAPYAESCWTDAAAYVGPGQDLVARNADRPEDPAGERDLSGGWFDAGDTNKYVTAAVQAVHPLLFAYSDYPQGFTDNFNIPESGNGIPDLIDEVRWEIDWLKKMQNADGSSLLKVGALQHALASPPSSDALPRYYVPTCTSATIASAGMMAHAALVFARFPSLAGEALDLKSRAIRGFDAYRGAGQVQTDCDDRRVVSGDADRTVDEQADMAVEAAIYLFALTGEARFHEHIRANYRRTMPYRDFGWARYDPQIGDALLFYAGLPAADPALSKTILADKLADARKGNDVYGMGDRDLYRNFLHEAQYHWGSNGMRVAYANSNLAMNRYGLDSERAAAYRARALETLHYLHGVNPFGIVYLSNMYRHGVTYSVNETFHSWFAARTRWSNALSSECGPPPGLVVGGPNANAGAVGVPASLRPPLGQPPQKAYRDWNETSDAAYAITESSVSYQANYVRLLAGVLSEAGRPGQR